MRSPAPRRSSARTSRSIRRKNLLLDQAKIDRARRIFNAPTETEAIHRALDAAADLEAFQRELDRGFEALIGAGGFADRFAGWYLVDSNVYIHAFRDSVFGESLRRFHGAHLPRLVLSAVVMHELLVGAATSTKEHTLRRQFVEPFRARRRLHVPSRQTWELTASIDRRLRRRPSLASKLRTRAFFNDMLIAASARELGAVVLTENPEDFGIISSVLDIRHVQPWPDVPLLR